MDCINDEDKKLQALYDNIDALFKPLKEILDKYPKSFQLDYHKEVGFFIDYDVTVLIRCLRSQC